MLGVCQNNDFSGRGLGKKMEGWEAEKRERDDGEEASLTTYS